MKLWWNWLVSLKLILVCPLILGLMDKYFIQKKKKNSIVKHDLFEGLRVIFKREISFLQLININCNLYLIMFGVIFILFSKTYKFGLFLLTLCNILIRALSSLLYTDVSIKCHLSFSCVLVGKWNQSCQLNDTKSIEWHKNTLKTKTNL